MGLLIVAVGGAFPVVMLTEVAVELLPSSVTVKVIVCLPFDSPVEVK